MGEGKVEKQQKKLIELGVMETGLGLFHRGATDCFDRCFK